jgi:hypothetical protein
MGQDLTGKLISATYEDLVQISGSILTDGTGSNITNLTITSSFATTASYAENAAGVPLALFTASINDATITFTKGDASTFDITVNNVVNASSASVATSASHAIFADTAGFATDVNALYTASVVDATISFLKGGGGTFPITVNNVANAVSASYATTASFALTASALVGGVSLQSVLDTGNTATQDINLTGDINATNITGSTVYASSGSFVNLNAVSASFGYVKTVTGSAVIIGDEFIILNADTPTARYAGLIVYDSGSGTPVTASFEWDGLTDNWIVVEESGNSAVVLTGASGSKGTETLPTLNTLVKGGGHHQLIDSIMSDDGSEVSCSGDFTAQVISASAYLVGNLIGTASFADNALSSSFATTASFAISSSADNITLQQVTDNGAITTNLVNLQGGIVVSGSALISSSVGTGSFIDNIPGFSGTPQINHVVSLTQAEYNAIPTPDDDTYFIITDSTGSTVLLDTIISGSLAVTGSATFTGSLTITGSLVGNVSALSISSNTASMDLNVGNFFTLQLVSGSDTFINPSNIAAGQTINLRVNTTGSATVSFPSSVKQVSGSSYVPTTDTGVDVITFISFDSTSLLLSNVKNLV